MARHKKHEEHVNHERWLVSYADFVTLLFATFTALFAISNADKEKFALMAKSLKNSFSTDIPTDVRTIGLKGRGLKEQTKSTYLMDLFPEQKKRGQAGGPGDDGKGTDPDATGDGQDSSKTGDVKFDAAKTGPGQEAGNAQSGKTGWMPQFKTEVKEVINESQLGQSLNMRMDKRGLVLSLSEAAFFEPESTYVKAEVVHKLDKLFALLKSAGYRIRVEAHMDDAPLTTGRFENAWDLTTARASKLLQHMITTYQFPPELISAAGYGSAYPIESNTTELGRTKNRRVDLVIEGPAGGAL